MLYPFPYYRYLVPGVVPLQKGEPFIDHYYQGKVFLYLSVLFNLTRAYFSVGKKI